MYEKHFRGTADILGFRDLGVGLRGMSADADIAHALDRARGTGVYGMYAQIELATLLFERFNPVTVPGDENVTNPGLTVHLWKKVQVLQNGLQDLIKNDLASGRIYRCDRKGHPVPQGVRAYGYYVIPGDADDVLDIQDAWSLLNEEVNL